MRCFWRRRSPRTHGSSWSSSPSFEVVPDAHRLDRRDRPRSDGFLLSAVDRDADDRDAQVAIYMRLTQRLAAAGANCVVVTSIAGHFCIAEFAAVSPLPVINLLTVAAAIQARGLLVSPLRAWVKKLLAVV